MSSLKERIELLENDLKAVPQRISVYHDLPFAILRYEPTEETAQHHDHIICERCGKIVEFNSEELEKQQERIARFLGFVVSHHRMELYGICKDCREGRRAVVHRAQRRERGDQPDADPRAVGLGRG